ncbi:hypothetical protein [Teichococcus aestuarii]|uniref:hypothetical protein n=1 Tax=Teichococcus aestuarii TaxID=568898 RepID=UPI00361575DA
MNDEALHFIVERAGAKRILALVDAAQSNPAEVIARLELAARHVIASGLAVRRSPRRDYATQMDEMDRLLAADPTLTFENAARIASGNRAGTMHMGLLRRHRARRKRFGAPSSS